MTAWSDITTPQREVRRWPTADPGMLRSERQRQLIEYAGDSARDRAVSGPVVAGAERGRRGRPELSFEEDASLNATNPLAVSAPEEGKATGEERERCFDPKGELTPQERRVAMLVADGATNREVAQALFVSHKTVEVHLTRIYRKLGLRSRTDLAREVWRRSPDDRAVP